MITDVNKSPSPAPSVLGLHLDDAARVCLALGLEVSIVNQWQVDQWGAAAPGLRVVEQRPAANNLTHGVEVRVVLSGEAAGAGAGDE